jgi:hypothetical protein
MKTKTTIGLRWSGKLKPKKYQKLRELAPASPTDSEFWGLGGADTSSESRSKLLASHACQTITKRECSNSSLRVVSYITT